MSNPILSLKPISFMWETEDPFLYCVHHNDAYPKGNDQMGPAVMLAGRNLGSDFSGKDGWSMYHGEVVPGFPQHPHRGFETLTVARRGLIDHSDSLGAAGRFGRGDAQWMTAGRGIVHAEMFPLLDKDAPNPVELFQIWINLPKKDKMVQPHYTMLWSQDIPIRSFSDEAGRTTKVTVIAGQLDDAIPPAPPPHSWASRPDSDVAVWSGHMQPHARHTLPAAQPTSNRSLYFFRGKDMVVAGQKVTGGQRIRLKADAQILLEAGDEECEWLLLQGKPIGERVVQHGPFVMNTPEEIYQAFADYRQTGFGNWPWPRPDPIHPRQAGRFARHADGKEEVMP
jgi:redox-sensitive bicupin YhaK (pirin superfamily)